MTKMAAHLLVTWRASPVQQAKMPGLGQSGIGTKPLVCCKRQTSYSRCRRSYRDLRAIDSNFRHCRSLVENRSGDGAISSAGRARLDDRVRRGMVGEMAGELRSAAEKARGILTKSRSGGKDVDVMGVLLRFLNERVIRVAS